MNIVYASNDNYARHLAVSMLSLFDRNRRVRQLTVWVISIGITPESEKKLESIGMNWTSVQVRNWTQYYEEAKRYFAEHGDLHIHAAYVTPSGLPLGTWITTQRYHYKTKKHITDEQIKLLEAIGMSWNRFNEKWEFAYAKALALFRETGDINVPEN